MILSCMIFSSENIMIFLYFQNINLYYYYLLTFLIHAYLTQTPQVPKLLDGAKILTKILTLWVHNTHTRRRLCWISSKSQFSLQKYDVIWIFKMAAVSHVVFALGHSTREEPFMVWTRSSNPLFVGLSCGDIAMCRFWSFGLKLHIHAPFGGVFGDIFQHDVTHRPDPQKDHLWS